MHPSTWYFFQTQDKHAQTCKSILKKSDKKHFLLNQVIGVDVSLITQISREGEMFLRSLVKLYNSISVRSFFPKFR